MKIVISTHSSVALRQQLCWKELSKHAEVLVIAPKIWGKLTCESIKEGNYELFADEVNFSGDINRFYFSDDAVKKIIDFCPDVIYNQNEIYCTNSMLTQKLAKDIDAKFVQFCWENLKEPDVVGKIYLGKCDYIIAGNLESKKLHNANEIMPQVGIDTKLFSKQEAVKTFGVIYIGREAKEKGCEYIKQAYLDTLFVYDTPYDRIPSLLNKSKIFVSYPFNIEGWHEQFNFSIGEALACEVPVITSDAGAIRQWYGISGALILPQHKPELLKYWIEDSIKYGILNHRTKIGREFVLKNYSNEVIVKRLINIFEELLAKKVVN